MEHDCCKGKHHETDVNKNANKKLKQNDTKKVMTYVVVGVLTLLLIFSIVQAVQVGSVKESISGGAVSISPQGSSGSSSPVRSAPQSAPTMVGGC